MLRGRPGEPSEGQGPAAPGLPPAAGLEGRDRAGGQFVAKPIRLIFQAAIRPQRNVVIEQVDKTFLKQHFKNAKGMLLKPERIRGLEYLGDDWAKYKDRYQPEDEPTKEQGQRLIDFTRLRLHQPEVVHDLPAGGRRLVQRAEGYRATLVAGTPTFEDGEETGARPGRLVRAGS